MCGIIGYIGDQQAAPVLLDGLQKLEYRGYDSSGIGVFDCRKKKIAVRKRQGKIAQLRRLIDSRPLPESSCGISHTRWATHGVPNQVNAHPHFDATKKILVVHNGIIENYQILKKELQARGVKFVSETDTEVISQMIGFYYNAQAGSRAAAAVPVEERFVSAVQQAIARFEGAFALGILCEDVPDALITARIGSPLIIGIGNNEHFIASDVRRFWIRPRRLFI